MDLFYFVENLLVIHLVKVLDAFHGTRGFITVFTTARHLFLLSVRWFQSTISQPPS